MFLEDWLGSRLQHYRVLHAIPGRIRLQIPFWKKLPQEWNLASNTMNLDQWLPGIDDVRVNSVTGTVLISYDHAAVSEGEILGALDEMADLLRRHRKQLAKFGPDHQAEALGYLQKIIEAHWTWLHAQSDRGPKTSRSE